VTAYEGKLLAARREGAVYSKDGGVSWDPVGLPSRVKDIRKVAFSKDGGLWVGAGDGVYFSRDFSSDGGKNWFWLEKVPVRDVGDLSFDEQTGRMLVSSRSSQVLYSVDPATLQFFGTGTGFRLFLARSAGGVRFATSLQDGVLIESTVTAQEKVQTARPGAQSGKANASYDSGVHPALPQR
jgi:ligand-binding sensor domain-containing protein